MAVIDLTAICYALRICSTIQALLPSFLSFSLSSFGIVMQT